MKNTRSTGVFSFWQPQQPSWLIGMADPLHHAKAVADMTRKKVICLGKIVGIGTSWDYAQEHRGPCSVIAASGIRQLSFLFLVARIEGKDAAIPGRVKAFGANLYYWMNMESNLKCANQYCRDKPEILTCLSFSNVQSLRNFRGQRE